MIVIEHLTKQFKNKTAVNDLSLTIQEGELFALLGVNGAGKTTTIRMLSCLARPTSGTCSIGGKDCVTESAAVKKMLGVSPQDTAVAENLTVRENLMFMAAVHGMDKSAAEKRTEEMLAMFCMEEEAKSRAKILSGGWKRKLSIAMALISHPRVLFLDEPTLGLDVLARRDLWKVIESLKGKITIVLTTHYMEEAEALADRIAIMLNGKLAACGTLSQLEAVSGRQGLEDAFVAIAEMSGGAA